MIEITKPKFDSRKMIGGKLKNNIKYVLVQDKHLDKSYVSVAIKTGSFYNPKGYDGLAHFLEHMLFMGSHTYKGENYYNTKLNENGGSSNAYTDKLETVYFFNVYDNALLEIIDIFSRFFIDPLFAEDSVDREINAVHSEHMKNINNDMWREFQLSLDLTDKKSVLNTFITGSLNTLKHDDIREKMIEFYKQYYTTDNISICIASSKSIADQKKILKNTFGSIPKTKGAKFKIIKPFYSKNKGKYYHIKSIANIYNLTYLWEIPIQTNYLTKEFTLLGMMLNNPSKEGLKFHLKNMGYINNINVEVNYEGTFVITFNLTKLGLDHIDYVENTFFSNLEEIFKLDNIKEYASYYQKVAELNFNCLNNIDSENLCNMLAVNHHYHNTVNVFCSSFLIQDILETEKYNELYKTLNFKDMQFIKIINCQDIKMMDIKYMKAREYNTEYAELVMNKITIKPIKTFCHIELNNPYLDVNPVIIPDLDIYNIPKEIKPRQWYGGTSKFNEPLVYICLELNNKMYLSSPNNNILTKLSCSILNFMINTIMYKPLELAYNINFSVSSTNSSIFINIKALNDSNKLQLLINELNNFLKNISTIFNMVSKSYIDNLIISLKETYQNIDFLNAWDYSSYYVSATTLTSEYLSETLLASIVKINYEMIHQYIGNLCNETALTTYSYGNIISEDVDHLYSCFGELFLKNIYDLPKINFIETTKLKHKNTMEKSNCISYYYPIGSFDAKSYVILTLFINIIGQSFFDDLRTKHQLGYLVTMQIYNIRDFYYIVQKIQSDKKINYVEKKINNFNKHIIDIIKNIDLKKYIDTLRNQINEQDNCIYDLYSRYLSEIVLRRNLFKKKELLLEQINNIKKSDLISLTNNLFKNKKNNMKKIIIEANL